MSTAARYRAACARLGLPVWRRGAVDTDGNVCPGAWADERKAEPDFTDPATIGVLLAAVREAWDGNDLHAAWHGWQGQALWRVWVEKYTVGVGPTEADALIAALEAAAARRGRQP